MKLSFLIQMLFLGFCFGAVVYGNILGTLSGQIGKKVVYFVWKGIDVVREWVLPSNPKTVLQTAQRNKFSAVIGSSKEILIGIIQPLWRKFAVKQSQFNAFVHANLLSQSFPLVKNLFIVTKGNLEVPSLTVTSVTFGAGLFSFGFSPDVTGNGLATDFIGVALWDSISKKWFYNMSGLDTRLDEVITIPDLPAELVPANLGAYIFAYRNLGSADEIVSDSVYHAVAAV